MQQSTDALIALAQSKGYGSDEADTQTMSLWLAEKMSVIVKTIGFDFNNETVYGYHFKDTRNWIVKNYYRREENWLNADDPINPALNRALLLL